MMHAHHGISSVAVSPGLGPSKTAHSTHHPLPPRDALAVTQICCTHNC